MVKKSSFSSQFRGGYYPDQPIDPGSPLNGHYVTTPSSKRNQGITRDSSVEARPGMVGKQDYSRKRKK